jgi:hypothetical protein
MKKYGSKRKKKYVMVIVKAVKPFEGLTVGRRYLKLAETNKEGEPETILTRNDKDEQAEYPITLFEKVDVASC